MVSGHQEVRIGAGKERTLAWETPGERGPARALCSTLRELLIHPAGFFDAMAPDGGLREPLTMAALLASAGVLISMPLALALAALASATPHAADASLSAVWTSAARACMFAAVLLPVVLCLIAGLLLVQGTIFHLGSRLFGKQGWEASFSVWCYATCAGLAALLCGASLACLLSGACWLWSAASPDAAARAAATSRWSLLAPGVGAGAGLVLFLACLVAGCTRALGIPGERGVAAALAGLLLVGAVACASVWAAYSWGAIGLLLAALLCAVALTGLAAYHKLAPGRPVPTSDSPRL